MKRALTLALSISMVLQATTALAQNRAAGIVDDVVSEGRAEKDTLRKMLLQMDANLSSTQSKLESSIRTGQSLKKMNLLVDSLTIGAGVTYVAARSVPYAGQNPALERTIQATATASFVALGLGIVSGEALSIARRVNRNTSANEIKAFATSALVKIDTTSRAGLPADVDGQVLRLRQSLVELRDRPSDTTKLEVVFDNLATASLSVGIFAVGYEVVRNSYMPIGEFSLMGGAAIGASTLLRMGTYLSPNDQSKVLEKIKSARKSISVAASKLR